MDRLSPLDALFLEAEDADRHTSMALASIAIFEGPPPAHEELVASISGRLPLVPRYRQRVRRVPFDLGPPVWVDDPRFDVRWHVRRTTVAPPGDDEQVRRVMGQVMAQRMDRDRPLWEYWILDGLADGRWAVITKLHHSMVDGVSATELYRVVFDSEPTPPPPWPDTWHPVPEPSALQLATGAVLDLAGTSAAGARTAVAGLLSPLTTARRVWSITRGLARYATALLPAPASSLSGPVGRHRRFTWARASRQDVATVRTAFGGTLNDVVLAAITYGFRQVLIARGEQPRPHLLRSLVPVSVHAPVEEGIAANRVSSMLPFLPIHLDDPVAMLTTISARLTELKASHEAEAGQVLTSLAAYDPFPAFAAPARLIFAHPQRIITTVTTNVPGPRTPVYELGRRAVEIIPYVPIANPVRVGVSILTYCDAVVFGITGDGDTTPDLDVLAAGIETATDALVRAARREARRQGSSTRTSPSRSPRSPRSRSPRSSRSSPSETPTAATASNKSK